MVIYIKDFFVRVYISLTIPVGQSLSALSERIVKENTVMYDAI